MSLGVGETCCLPKTAWPPTLNRYKEIVFGAEDTRDPLEIIAEIKELDAEIAAGMGKLEAMLQEGK